MTRKSSNIPSVLLFAGVTCPLLIPTVAHADWLVATPFATTLEVLDMPGLPPIAASTGETPEKVVAATPASAMHLIAWLATGIVPFTATEGDDPNNEVVDPPGREPETPDNPDNPDPPVNHAPEPGSLALALLGGGFLSLYGRRRTQLACSRRL